MKPITVSLKTALFCMSLVLVACSHLDKNKDAEKGNPFDKNRISSYVYFPDDGIANTGMSSNPDASQNTPGFNNAGNVIGIGEVPRVSSSTQSTDYEDVEPPAIKKQNIKAFVTSSPLPDFINIVFKDLLDLPYVTSPAVLAKKDIVTLNAPKSMPGTDFLELIEGVLQEYGVRIIPREDHYYIVEDAYAGSTIPRFIKSRARPDVRADLRPVSQIVEMKALSANSMTGFLSDAFGKKNDKVRFNSNSKDNFVSLMGLPEDVAVAIDIINEMDELRFAGTQVQRYTPKYWSAENLGVELSKALTVEGWQVTSTPEQTRHIFVMPVQYSNDLFIFSKSEAATTRIRYWLSELDKKVEGGDSEEIHIYQVKNIDAVILSEVVNAVISAQKQGIRPVNNNTDKQDNEFVNSFTVDPLGNRLLFTGTQAQYEKTVSLLEKLDTPAPEVLIEVQIAEVALTGDTAMGVEWFSQVLNSSSQVTAQTGGLGLGSSGLSVGVFSGDVNTAINAFSSNRNVKVLSSPVLTARSGSSASIQVGQDVPVVTSQRAANNQDGDGSTDILQNIAYRKTGVLMTIEPIVFSDDRIDLTITQEVSSTLDTNTGLSSPTISNRNISTQLSLEDGETAVLGGLIQENFVRDEQGVPLAKDIPILGSLFSVNSVNLDRTELVVLITAYVLRSQDDKSRFVDAYKARLGEALSEEDPLYTLLPKKF